MAPRIGTRRKLIANVWPDKLLFSATLLLISAVLGILHGLVFTLFDVTVAVDFPRLLREYPPEAVLVLSIVQAAGAYVALRRQRTVWALGAAVAGVASFSLFGLGSILALVALAFALYARLEGEDAIDPDSALDPDEWPDKSLAASTVLTVMGVLMAGWGYAIANDRIQFQGYMDGSASFGWICMGLALLSLVAAGFLYFQRAPWLGVAAGVAGIASFTLYVLGPILAIVALVLIRQASGEDEFDPSRKPVAAPPVPRAPQR